LSQPLTYIWRAKKGFHRNSNGKYQDKEEDSDIIKCIIQKPIGIDELVKRIKEQLNS